MFRSRFKALLVGLIVIGLVVSGSYVAALELVTDPTSTRLVSALRTLSTSQPAATFSPQPQASPDIEVPLSSASALVKKSANLERVTVSQVIDGDTIRLSDGRTVRYIGVDTPETVHPTKGVECFGQAASSFNRSLVAGQTVELEKDVSETDRYGRLLRYVWLKDQLINLVLVEHGYAYASSYPPDIAHQPVFQAVQTTAQQQARGLWASCPLREKE